jgi:hypothetical protein
MQRMSGSGRKKKKSRDKEGSSHTAADPDAWKKVLASAKTKNSNFIIVQARPLSDMTEDTIHRECVVGGRPLLFENVITDKWDMNILSHTFLAENYGNLKLLLRDNNTHSDFTGYTMAKFLNFWMKYVCIFHVWLY